MFKDDIEALPSLIPNHYDPKLVLAEQTKLAHRYLPLALLGTLFTALCFVATMYITYDLSNNQKILNIFWIVYQAIILGSLWQITQLILKRVESLSLKFLKNIFISFAILFSSAMILGIIVFTVMLLHTPEMMLLATNALVVVWIVFHSIILTFCWSHWEKIKALFHKLNAPDKPIETDHTQMPVLSAATSVSHAHYLANYAAYSVLFVCALAIACLWALAIGKAFTTNIQNSTQVIVLLGLHLGLLSGGISCLATFWRVYIAYALPSVFVWIFLLSYMTDTGLIILAFAVIGLLFFDIFFARHTSINTLKAILVYIENESLIAQLQIKTRQVEEASLAKTKILASASHDLRQPVHALSLFIEALADTDLDLHQSQIVDYAKSASHSSREMLNTILDYAHIESGQMTAQYTATNLDSIIQNLIDEFGIQADNKGLSLRYTPKGTWVMTDPTMIALILRNLISNAIRYTNEGGIVVGVRKSPIVNQSILITYCRVSVWDTGSGMTADETEQIFESFYQIERNKTTDQGLGLGLAIVKGMTQLLKAELDVKSSIGVGSQFSIVLPTCQPINDGNLDNNTTIDHLKQKVVLIIDDDDAVLKSMQLLLGSWGCQPIAVKTLEDAVTAFAARRPDIVITDFRLANNVTGEDIILAIRKSSDLANATPFIILTADTSPQLFTATKAINPLVLHKPIDPKNLRQQLQQILAK
ncbi:ATP-binding protein [Psychrobacter sp. DM4]|uniref:sensor histidine kinase n=1 Tax=Psychrobacter sp. DM4 TaxID=3440637 RepID=UPI003F5044EB